MPMTYNEPTVPTYPASVVLPTAGDGVGSTSGAAPADPVWLKLQNGVAGARFQGFGGGIRRCLVAGATSRSTPRPRPNNGPRPITLTAMNTSTRLILTRPIFAMGP